MNLGIRDKTALVLAASKGMGFASAMALAEEGMKVAICARTKKDLEKAASEIESKTKRPVLARALDVEERAAAREMVAAVQKEFGGLHVLVANCGGPPPGKPLEMTDEQWDAAVESTLMVSVNWTRAAAPVMIRQKWGRIIHITSIAVKQPIDSLILSNTMRAGVAGFAKTMSRELAPHGITVNTLCPGMILTDRLRVLADSRAKSGGFTVEEAFQRMTAEIPAGRIGTPEEFAAVVAFLASERAGYVNGALIQVDGGAYRGLV
jgi:3-oxoacyl-[acyl-carrier protein] reductase